MNSTTIKLLWTKWRAGFLLIIVFAVLSVSKLSFSMNNNGNIFDAIKKEDLQEVMRFVKEGVDFKKTNQIRKTPLYWACWKGNIEIVKFLLENGARETINVAEPVDDQTPLFMACLNSNLKLVELLLENGAKETINKGTKRSGGQTPLYWACNKGNLGIVKLLLGNGADVDKLSLCGAQGKSEILKYLNLVKDCDNLVIGPNEHYKVLGFIDNQDDGIMDCLCKRLYVKCGKKYCGIQKSLNLFGNKRGAKKFLDCRITTQE